jgi:hypothetical protein
MQEIFCCLKKRDMSTSHASNQLHVIRDKLRQMEQQYKSDNARKTAHSMELEDMQIHVVSFRMVFHNKKYCFYFCSSYVH